MNKTSAEKIQEAFKVMEERKRIAKLKVIQAQVDYDREALEARAEYNKVVDAAEDNAFKGTF